MDRCTAGKGGIEIHHAGVETVAGVRGDAAVSGEVEPTMVPLAERRDVAVYKLTAFRRSRGTGGVKENEYILWFWATGY